VLRVFGQEFQDTDLAPGASGKHVGECTAPVDGKFEFIAGLAHSVRSVIPKTATGRKKKFNEIMTLVMWRVFANLTKQHKK
jgi:hypothetical protein